jgi:hypothetical protein
LINTFKCIYFFLCNIGIIWPIFSFIDLLINGIFVILLGFFSLDFLINLCTCSSYIWNEEFSTHILMMNSGDGSGGGNYPGGGHFPAGGGDPGNGPGGQGNPVYSGSDYSQTQVKTLTNSQMLEKLIFCQADVKTMRELQGASSTIITLNDANFSFKAKYPSQFYAPEVNTLINLRNSHPELFSRNGPGGTEIQKIIDYYISNP